MKKIKLGILASLALYALSGFSAEKIVGGPRGGRLLETESPRPEFFVEKDRTVTITFYDAHLKPVAATKQGIAVIAELKSGKVKLEFEKKGDVLVSRTPLPDGDGYNLVVLFIADSGAKPQNFRFTFDTATCGECKRSEYACICGH